MPTFLAPEAPDTSLLRAWREQALAALLRAALVLALLPLAVDTVGSLQRGQTEHVAYNITLYAVFLLFTFRQPFSFERRVQIIIGIWLGFNCYTLMTIGLISSGRVSILAHIMLAALLLGRRQAIVTWLLGGLGVGLSLAYFQSQPAGVLAAAMARMDDPNTLLTQSLITVGLSGFLAYLALWLIGGLGQSLHVARQALAERDALNAALERRVAELEQALASQHASAERYRALFHAIPQGITITDRAGRPLERNLAAQRMIAWGGADARLRGDDGQPLPSDDEPGLRAIREGRPIYGVEASLAGADGGQARYEVTAAPLDLPGYGALVIYNDISARHEVEGALKRQLEAQAASARSSQLLLASAITDDAQRRMLTAALESLYATINPRPIYLLRNVEDARGELLVEVAIRVGTPHSGHRLDRPIPWKDLPAGVRRSLESGDLWAGPTQSMLTYLPWLHKIFREQAIHSILCFPIFVDRQWWGAIFFADEQPDRAWGAYETLLLRTIAEVIGTTLKRWQAEAGLSQQLRYAEALARCSQLLLDGGGDPATREGLVRQVLDTLRVALDASYLLVYQRSDTLVDGLPYTIPAVAADPALPPPALPSPAQVADTPRWLSERLDGGQIFNGPVGGHFAGHPRFAEIFERNGIQSALMIPLALGGRRWGLIQALDCSWARSWDAPSVQLLRTAAEMLASAQQGWEAARALAERERFIQRVMHATPDIIYVFDLEARSTVYINHAMVSIAGYDPDLPAVRNMPVGEILLSPEDQARLDAHRRRLAESADGVVQSIEYPVRLADGQTRWILSRDQIFLHNEHGQVRQILCIAQDITERKLAAAALLRAKEAAEAADTAKTTFLAHMSHEIRTPLTAIIGMASLLAEGPLSQSQRESVAIIRTGGETLLSLIGNILDFSKIEAGQFDLVARPFDLPATCRAAIDLVGHAAARKGLALDLQIAPDMPKAVIGDGGRLRQVLLNLLANAVKYTASGGVSLRVAPGAAGQGAAAEILFVVADTGVGIAPERLEQIFQPFVQIANARGLPEGGTGLGLTISRQLARLMGGQLTVESTPGAGTAFTLALPLVVADAPTERPPSPAPLSPSAALRVLIAEDNPINQEVLQRMLDQIGVVVTVVGDGVAALAELRASAYDLVLMDIQMPAMDGEEAARQVRALGPAIRQPYIVALTASALRGDRERYMAAGMDDYLSKPVQIEDLQRVLVSATSDLPPDVPLLNLPAIEHLCASFQMPRAQARALVRDLFERELLSQLAAIAAAVADGDCLTVRRLAHKLSGGSRQLGASALAAASARLESIAQQADVPGLDAALARLRATYDRSWAQLQEHVDGGRGA